MNDAEAKLRKTGEKIVECEPFRGFRLAIRLCFAKGGE